jgi:magnesium transporter
VHPLTIEDIQTSDTREKCEVFENYIFLCIRIIDDSKHQMDTFNLHLIVFHDYVLSVHYSPLSHIKMTLSRLDHLDSYIQITSEWIMYSVLDEVTDQFIPIISTMEVEVDVIDDLVLVLSENEQSDLLRRIGNARKKVTFLQRVLRPKHDLLKVLTKRCTERISASVMLYLRDIHDHLIEMTQNLEHFNETLNRSHGNYLAQINIEITQASNRMNVVMKKFTAAAAILLPLQLMSGMWGMNIPVPGETGTSIADYGWFIGMTCAMLIIASSLIYVGHKNKWL